MSVVKAVVTILLLIIEGAPSQHIGIELEFIYDLTRRIIASLESGEQEEASKLFEIRTDFISRHIDLWVLFFADKVRESAHRNFFKGAAGILKGFI
jgi:TorA maturation chaperone TorD